MDMRWNEIGEQTGRWNKTIKDIVKICFRIKIKNEWMLKKYVIEM